MSEEEEDMADEFENRLRDLVGEFAKRGLSDDAMIGHMKMEAQSIEEYGSPNA